MSDFGLQSYGLEIPSFEEWRDLYFNLARQTYGADVNVDTNSVIGQMLSIPCYQDILIWQALAGVYASQTINGAEGIYLDEILSKRGVFRNPAEKGSGFAFVNTNKNASWTLNIPTSTSFTSASGENYLVSVDTQLRDRVAAYKVSIAEIQAATASITYYITNTTTSAIESMTFDTTSPTLGLSLVSFINSNLSVDEAGLAILVSGVVYFGFSSTNLTSPIGLTTTVRFYSDTLIGDKWSNIPVVSQVVGVYPVGVNEINGMTPTPSVGYVGVGNFTSFFSGSEVETDAEYRERFNATVDEAVASTRPAILKAISSVAGVSKVRIYDNPTRTDTAEAPALTFNTVVLGGDIVDIAQTLYKTKPINTLTTGTVSYTVDTSDGGIEIIRYTPATDTPYEIKVQYSTVDNTALSSAQKSAITSSLINLQTQFVIGTKIFNAQLSSVIFNAVSVGVFSSLTILTKKVGSGSFTNADIIPLYSEIISFDEANITYEQII